MALELYCTHEFDPEENKTFFPWREWVWNRIAIIVGEDIADPVAREIVALKELHDLANQKVPKSVKGDRREDKYFLKYVVGAAGQLHVVKAVMLLCAANKSRDADNFICLDFAVKPLSDELAKSADEEAKALLDTVEADETKIKIPAWAKDHHTLAGQKRGKRKTAESIKVWIKAEDAELTPRVPGVFDNLLFG